jgi:hypothetical protein
VFLYVFSRRSSGNPARSLCKSVGRIENWTGDVGPVTLTSKTRCSLRSRMQEWRGVGDVEVGRWKGGDGRTSPRLREGEVR